VPPPTTAVYTVRSLEQARILSDPLRVRLLREFVEEPRTTKQVADRLGENAPKLYRHVQALVDAGLLELKEERKKRGTTERYLQAVAARFEVDASLFASAGRGSAKGAARQVSQMVTRLFASAQEDLLAYCADPASEANPPTVARILARGSPQEIAKIRRRIMTIIESGHGRAAKRGSTEEVELTGLIAFHVSKPPGSR
jgi:DNA-binding transcriptional ArsR family regulator